MPYPVSGNCDRDPAAVLASLYAAVGAENLAGFVAALDAAGLVFDQTGQIGAVLSVTDSGNENGGDGGGTQALVTCRNRHGLIPGDTVTLTGCGAYSGTYQIEPAGDLAFLLDNVAYSGDAAGGSWS